MGSSAETVGDSPRRSGDEQPGLRETEGERVDREEEEDEAATDAAADAELEGAVAAFDDDDSGGTFARALMILGMVR